MPVNIIDTLKPKNGLNFPVVEAIDVFVEDYENLADAISHFATDVMIEAINAVLSGKANTSDVNTAVANLQGQIDQIVISASAESIVAPEVAAARVGADGTSYQTLKARLDSDDEKAKKRTEALEVKTDDFISQIADSNIYSITLSKINGKLLTKNGVVTDGGDNYYVSDLIDISDYSTIYITAQSGYNNRLYAFYDANEAFVSDYLGGTGASKSITDFEVIVPENAKYIRLSQWYNTTPMACKYVTYVTAGLSELQDNVLEVSKNVLSIENAFTTERTQVQYSTEEGYIIIYDGSKISASSSYIVSEEVSVTEYNKVYISGSANYGNLLYAFYDENSVFISGESSVSGETITKIEGKEVNVPADATTIIIANVLPQTSNLEVNQLVVSGIQELEEDVDSLSESITTVSNELSGIVSTETYPVVLHPDLTMSEGYVDKGGGEHSSDSYKHTQKIPVKTGDVIYLMIRNNVVNCRFITAYNGDTVVFASSDEYVNKYTVPNGITFVIFSISANYSDPTCVKETVQSETILKPVSENDILYGKKWAVLGDSFSYGGYSPMNTFDSGRYAGSRKVYPYYIGNRTHINIVDFTLGGRTLAYPSDETFSNSLTNPNAEFYYQNIPVDIDYITIYIGINDSHHASGGGDGEDPTGYIPIGTVDDDTTASFGGAWNVVLSWLIANRPNAHIGIIVSNGCDSDAYRTLTIAIAQKYGIPYIDLNGDQNTPAMIRTTNPGIASAVKNALIAKWAVKPGVNTHPNDDAHEFESHCIEAFLRRL